MLKFNRRKIILSFFLCGLVLSRAPNVIFSQEKISDGEKDPIIISVTKSKEIYFNKDKISQDEITQRIGQAFDGQSLEKQVVYLKADRDLEYKTIAPVIRQITNAGIGRVGLLARKKDESKESFSPDASRVTSRSDSSSAKFKPSVIKAYSKKFVTLNRKRTSVLRLPDRLKKLLRNRNDKTVVVIAANKMIYGDVVKIIDIIRNAGAQTVELR